MHYIKDCSTSTQFWPTASADCFRIEVFSVMQDGVSGPAGITPFHLAVFLSDAQSFALMLCASLGAHHWFASTTRDGHSPADFAVRCGKDSLSDAITNSAMRASADCACFAGASDDQQPRNRTALLQGETQACSHELHVAASTSVGGWSDSSSSSDDSGSDLEASHHGGSVMSVMPSPGLQPYQVLSAATKFVQDGKERLAAVIRGKWSSY